MTEEFIVIKKVGADPEIVKTDNLSLESFQEIVGGYIENVYLHEARSTNEDRVLALVVNEEGLLLGLPPNIRHPGHPQYPITGDIVACAYDAEGLTRCLTDVEARAIARTLRELSL